MIFVMIAGLVVWMFGCAYAGYSKRFGLFVIVLLVGLALNTLWMVLGLQAKPLSPPAIAAHAGAVMYAITAVGFGWLAGRMVRGFRESRVDSDE